MTDELTEGQEELAPMNFPQTLELLIKMAQVEVIKQQMGPGQEISFLKFHTPFITITIPLTEDSVDMLVKDLRGIEGSARIIIPRGNMGF